MIEGTLETKSIEEIFDEIEKYKLRRNYREGKLEMKKSYMTANVQIATSAIVLSPVIQNP